MNKIRTELLEILTKNNIIFTEEPEWISCKNDKYRIYVIEQENILKYSWNEVPRTYFYDISYNNEMNGIHTVWIKSFEWDVERKKDILISGILCDLGVIYNRYYGRQTIIDEINSKDAQKFLDENSFYGRRGASLTLGLRNKKTNELLMLMSFGSSHYARKKWDCEIIRAATKKYSQVVGGATKLFKHFLENYPQLQIGKDLININTILFYVDYDHKQGNSMPSLGYELHSYTGFGFHNYCIKDCVFGQEGTMFMRKPHKHQEIMQCIRNGEVVSICNAGNKVFIFDKSKNNKIDSNSQFVGE
ncbi:hypothetical protein M0Q97_03025 [Candidatus Dojkabacteria bacterium]|jgi:hypothetical protein|nr:hypothetical protein [Candidatus Dojkabacteria bacterium]